MFIFPYQRPWKRWVNWLQRFVIFRFSFFWKSSKNQNRSSKKVFKKVTKMKNQRGRICSFFRALSHGLRHLYQRPWKRWVNWLQRFVIFRFSFFWKSSKNQNRSSKKVCDESFRIKNLRWQFFSFFRALLRGLWLFGRKPYISIVN